MLYLFSSQIVGLFSWLQLEIQVGHAHASDQRCISYQRQSDWHLLVYLVSQAVLTEICALTEVVAHAGDWVSLVGLHHGHLPVGK